MTDYNCGTVLLAELYDFVRKHCSQDADNLRLERTSLGKEYSQTCNRITAQVDETQGFYLWGAYNKKGLWENIYLGKAGFGDHKDLRKRIREELKDERCSIWRCAYTPEELHSFRITIHEGKYDNEWNRAMRKSGSTHIVWVSAPRINADQVINVEADLIESLNPRANRMRATPPDSLQFAAKEIFGRFRECIHKNRRATFLVQLKGRLSLQEPANS
jgi:hypothetical protein